MWASDPMMFPKEAKNLISTKQMAWILLAVAVLIPQPARAQSGDTVIYYHTDAIGSVRMITDASGAEIARYDFLPFGQAWPPPQNPPDVRQFAGKEHDPETKLDYFGTRYLRAESGRFTSVDPGHVGGDVLNPQSWNGYAYALNNPFRFVDPLGARPCQITLKGADAAAAGVADGGTVEGVCVEGNESWRDRLSRNLFGLLDALTLAAPVQAPGIGQADQPIVDRSPDTAVLIAAAAIGATPAVAGRISGRLTQEGLEHIVLRHWATSGAKAAGKFLPGTSARSLKGLISQALEQGAVRANTAGRAGQIVEYNFGRQIGVSMSGGPATRLRVVLSPDGTVITAFPY